MVDFRSLPLPGMADREVHPVKIFEELPAGNSRISNLWTGQELALNEWFDNREEADTLLELNTGAGKSLVGLLIAESAARQNAKVLYLCPNIDLVEQVSREADSIGLKYSTRVAGDWSNDLYRTERGFAITTYHALITPVTVFRRDLTPTTVIFDDAHVAEGIMRDQYTVSVDRGDGISGQRFQDNCRARR